MYRPFITYTDIRSCTALFSLSLTPHTAPTPTAELTLGGIDTSKFPSGENPIYIPVSTSGGEGSDGFWELESRQVCRAYAYYFLVLRLYAERELTVLWIMLRCLLMGRRVMCWRRVWMLFLIVGLVDWVLRRVLGRWVIFSFSPALGFSFYPSSSACSKHSCVRCLACPFTRSLQHHWVFVPDPLRLSLRWLTPFYT